MQNTNYLSIINCMNHNQIWELKRISLIIELNQYVALLKGYQPHVDMKYGLIYDFRENYFYAYRSGIVVGKYRFSEISDNRYQCTEIYDNPGFKDCMAIFPIVIEACNQNNIFVERKIISKYREETNRLHVTERKMSVSRDIGPQSPSDSPFTAKARKHQSLWRVQNGLEIGVGPNKDAKNKNGELTYYGNYIKDGELTGRNFYFPETFAYAKWRVEHKLKAETIDSYRLFNNLLSSMPMAFNLFHPLMKLRAENPAVVDNMIRAAFSEIKEIFRVAEIGLEFIPTPTEDYTGDKTAMDAFIKFQDKAGNNYLIAIETKYTDSLGSNTTSNKKVYQKQLKLIKESGLFTEDAISMFQNGTCKITQLYRNFMLAEVYGQKHGFKKVYSVILAPKDHPSTQTEIATLKGHLNYEVKKRVLAKSLEDFTHALGKVCPFEQCDWIDWFRNRYLII